MGSRYGWLIGSWINGLAKEQALIAVVNRVRDIPFQYMGTRDIDSLLANGAGTCTAKHDLLKELLDDLGHESQYVIDKMMLGDFLKYLNHNDPKVQELEKISSTLKPYYHTHLQIKADNRWCSVDITFDYPLKKHGFVIGEWDGKNDTAMPHISLERFIIDKDPDGLKKMLLKDEMQEEKEQREIFFKALNDYIAVLRAGG